MLRSASTKPILSVINRHRTLPFVSSYHIDRIATVTMGGRRRSIACYSSHAMVLIMVAATTSARFIPNANALSVMMSYSSSTSNASNCAGMMPPLSSNAKDIAEHLPLARRAMDYLDRSPDPFHAVQTSVERLQSIGFEELDSCTPFTGAIKPGGMYYFTKDRSTLVAFAVGEQYQAGNGFKIICGHTDSPNLKVKPRSKRGPNSGYAQIAVECYGGGLWHTWFDRDLGISGRVLVRNAR